MEKKNDLSMAQNKELCLKHSVMSYLSKNVIEYDFNYMELSMLFGIDCSRSGV